MKTEQTQTIATPIEQTQATPGKSVFTWLLPLTFLAAITAVGIYYADTIQFWMSKLPQGFYLFVLAGFIAQMIDGALGMAYGVSASTFLLTFGVSPAAASASIHTSEIFTSGVSGLMHLKFRNVNKKLFRSLLLPGILGAALGALVLSSLEPYSYIISPAIALYTFYLGVIIVRKAWLKNPGRKRIKSIPRLATFGGFMDSIGGGGWGPIVSSTLIAKGRHARYTIGTVNLAEFFVALASSLTFFAIIGLSHWYIIAGLISGGVIAAPIAAFLTRKLPLKIMMIMVGSMVILISLRTIIKAALSL